MQVCCGSVFWSRVEKARKSDPPDHRKVGSRLGAVAFPLFRSGLKRHQKDRQKLSKWVPGPQSSGPRACIKWLWTMPASVSWVSTFFTKKQENGRPSRNTGRHGTKTHHRPVLRALLVIFFGAFFGVWDQTPRNHQKGAKTLTFTKHWPAWYQTHHRPILRVLFGPEAHSGVSLIFTQTSFF